MGRRTNEEWMAVLSAPGLAYDAAVADLRALLLRGLGYSLSPRPGLDDALLEDFVQDALLKILAALDSFRGESHFTTWAQKIALRAAFSELRRRRWRDVSLDELVDTAETALVPRMMADPSAGPEQQAIQQTVLEAMRRVMDEQLTDRQRRALIAITVQGMPLEEVARRMDTKRNALYKLLHDARQRLKGQLLAQGLSAEEILAAFED